MVNPSKNNIFRWLTVLTSFFSQLKQRAVAYVNVADCVSGDVLEAEASFSLKSVVDRAMKNIPDPTETEYSSSRSYFDYFNNGGGMGGGWEVGCA